MSQPVQTNGFIFAEKNGYGIYLTTDIGRTETGLRRQANLQRLRLFPAAMEIGTLRLELLRLLAQGHKSRFFLM